VTAQTLTIAYKCRCMAAEAEILVRARGEREDIADWVREAVQVALSSDHMARSPLCRSPTVEHCKIPMPENAPYVGAAPRLDS